MEFDPAAVMLSFGEPGPFVDQIRRSDAVLIVQVTDMDEAKRAVEVGADIIVAQGTESGGHGARHGRSTLPFAPLVVDLAAPVQVLAAGGIGDGRGVAAALAFPPLPVWAGEAVDRITGLPSAADLVTTLAAQAEDTLTWAGRRRPNHRPPAHD